MVTAAYGLLHLADGGVEYVSGPDDFAQMIRDRLGFDSEGIVRELMRQANYATHKAESDLGAYESELESARHSFEEIADKAAAIERLISAARVNKREVQRLLDGIMAEAASHI